MATPISWVSHRLAITSVFLLQVLWISTFVTAQTPPRSAGPDPVKNFCARWWSQSVVKNDVLYIDSGIEKFNESGDIYFGINNYMLTIPLTEVWDWKRKKNESQFLNITTERKNETNPNTGTPIPSLFRGYMFHGPVNTSDVYQFGGTTYMYNQSFEGYAQPESSSYPLWTYNLNASGSPWYQYNVAQSWRPNHGAGADATDHALGFYLNGQIDMGTSSKTVGKLIDNDQNLYMPLEGMLVINLVDFNTANISTSEMRGSKPRVGGTMEYVAPVGDNGIMVALGGQIQPDVGGDQVANRSKGELIDFTSVDVFDIDSYLKDPSSNGSWYQQTTTGDIPAPRIDFCTVSISALDNSSHHIYLYGGINPVNDKSYDDVVVLTMPSFTWTTVWPQGESPRWGHNCHIAGKRQMITVGGNITNAQCDWEKKGVAVLELSTIDWGSVFRTNITSDYQVPKNILGATGGTVDGKATIGEPRTGWNDKGLQEIFYKSRWTVPTTWTSGRPSSSKPNVGAIAGGVVGGVAGVALIAAALFFWHRRRVKARSPAELHSDAVQRELAGEKDKYELQGVNENDPAELPGPETVEMDAPREFVEADHDTATNATELPGTNVALGGLTGVPIVRTPGDDLPESPEYIPGLRRPRSMSSSSSRRRRRRSSEARREEGQETREEYFQTPATELPKNAKEEENQEYFATPAEIPRDVKEKNEEYFATPAEEVPRKKEEASKDTTKDDRKQHEL